MTPPVPTTASAAKARDLLPWFRLKAVHGIGNLICKRLIDAFGSPEAVFSAPPERLARVEGISDRLARGIIRQALSPTAPAEIELAAKSGCRILCLTDPGYPDLLRQIADPPALLYVRGNLDPAAVGVAVVGSRRATRYGLEVARQLGSQLARAGITVVSGLALGIDTAAHQGALAAGGPTVAVLGSGLLRVYPPENEKLFEQIACDGAVISEFSLTAGPDAPHFPQRNRIISGISRGTVVVEAAMRSGALITARLAAEQNREVFAVPGSIRSTASSGTHLLIQQGAKLVANAADIIEELTPFAISAGLGAGGAPPPSPTPQAAPGGLTPAEQLVYSTLEPYPEHIDALAKRLDMATGPLAAILLALELKGLAVQHPGMHFGLKQ